MAVLPYNVRGEKTPKNPNVADCTFLCFYCVGHYNYIRPDITVMIDWALKNQLSIMIIIILGFFVHCKVRSAVMVLALVLEQTIVAARSKPHSFFVLFSIKVIYNFS